MKALTSLKVMICVYHVNISVKMCFFIALGDKNVVKCRKCGGDHWTSKCPWKDTILAGGKLPDDKKPAAPGGKYIS